MEQPSGRRVKLVAKKFHVSLAVVGELPEDVLAVYGDYGDNLMLVLARKIVSGEEDTEGGGGASDCRCVPDDS